MVVFFFSKYRQCSFFFHAVTLLRVPSWPLRVDVVGLFIDGMELKTLEKSLKDSLLFVVCLFLLEKAILLYKLSVTVMISGRECFWRSWFSSWQSFVFVLKRALDLKFFFSCCCCWMGDDGNEEKCFLLVVLFPRTYRVPAPCTWVP